MTGGGGISQVARYPCPAGDRAGEARTLNSLGNLYAMERLEEAVRFYRQSADIRVELKDMAVRSSP